MTMSTRGMKLLAFIMAVAIVLSGLVYSPKAAKAADSDVPAVRVLGATLKMGEVNGTQSMRIAIEISKASAANGCAMELTVGGKSVFVRTSTFEGSESAQIHDNVYSKNVPNDSVVYAVVLKGIPQARYDQEIGIKGHVQYKAASAEDEPANAVASSDPATRTVYGVVEAMQADYPGLNIGDDGNLYIGDRLLGEENIERTANVDITSVDQKESEYVDFDDRNNMLINDTREEGSTELYFPLPYPVQPGQWVEVTVSGKSWGTNDFRIWTTPADSKTSGSYVHNNGIYLNPTISEDGSYVGTVSLQAIDRECTNLTFKPQHGFRIQDLIISSISVKYLPIELPTIGFNEDKTEYTLEFTNGSVSKEKEDASFTIDSAKNTVAYTTSGQYSAMVFDVPAEVSDNYSVSAVELTYENADSTFATEVVYTDGVGAEANFGTEAGSHTVTRTVNIAYGHELDVFKIFSMQETGLNITIKSVKFILTNKPLFSGWNEAHTEYTLDLDSVLWENSNATKTKNSDGTYTYVKADGGEFGFGIPADIYNNYRFTNAVVKYRDASWGGSGYTVHYGTDTIGWISGEEAHYSGEFNGTGERSLSINYANEDGTNYSNTRFFNGTNGGSVTIEAIVLSGIYVPTPTPVPTATPAPTFRPVISADDADLQVNKTDKVITVDGNADDEAWADAAELDVANYSNVATDTTGKAKLLWDDSNLYLLLTVKDSAIIADNANPWENDGIELFFDEDLSKENSYGSNPDAFQYRFTEFTSSGAETDTFASAGSNASALYEGIATEYQIVDGGYVIEVAVPFANPATIQPGVGMGFELSMLDAISGSRRNEVWLLGGGKGNLYQDPSLMGTIQLVEAGVVVATPVPTAVPTAVPTKQPTGFNADNTKYVLDLNADTVKIDAGQTNYTFAYNPDGSLGFHAGGGYIGFSMFTPAEVLENYVVSRIEIAYENATVGLNGCTKYVGADEAVHWGEMSAGSGTIDRTLDTNAEFEYYKFFPNEACDVTIKSVTYTLVEKPEATPAPTKNPTVNLATNGDFSNGNAGWTSNYGGYTPTVVDGSGLYSGRWNCYSAATYKINRRFAAGDVVEFEFDVKLVENYAENGDHSFTYWFANSNGTEGDKYRCYDVNGSVAYGNAEGWTTVKGSYTVPAYTENLTIYIAEGPGYNADRKADFYIDNFYITTENAEPAAPTPVPTAAPDYAYEFAVDLSADYVTLENGATLNADGSVSIASTGVNKDYITVALPAEIAANEYTKVTIEYADVEIPTGNFSYKYQGTGDEKWWNFSEDPKWYINADETTKTIEFDASTYPVNKFIIIDLFGDGNMKSMTVKSIVFSKDKPVEIIGNISLDLANADYTLDEGVNASYNGTDNVFVVDFPAGNGQDGAAINGIKFTVPEEYKDYTFEYVELSVVHAGSLSSKTTRMNLIDKNGNMSSEFVTTTSSQTMSITLDKATAGVDSIQGIKLFRDHSAASCTITAIKFFYSATDGTEVPAGKTYSRINSVSDIQDGDKIVMVSNNNENNGLEIMLPEVVNATKPDGSSPRTGFNVEAAGFGLASIISGDYEAKEWTFTKSGDNWLVGTVDGYITLTQGDGQITATLENEGSVFTIGGSADAFTFTAADGKVLNRNGSRPVINGYANNPASFALYRLESDEVSP